jgi:hypothetical protein
VKRIRSQSIVDVLALAGALACAGAGCTGQVGEMDDPLPSGETPSDRPSQGRPAPGAPTGGGSTTPGTTPAGPGPGALPPVSAGTPTLPPVATPVLSRLTHDQWENTVRDLLRLPKAPGLSQSFPAESNPSRFDNQGGTLAVDGVLWTEYQRAAEQLARQVSRDPAALMRLVPAQLPDDLKARGRAIAEALLLRAYRRPPDADELTRAVALFDRGSAGKTGAEATAGGVELLLEGVLQAPQFLYRTEIGRAGKELATFDDYELASRLSYALSGSMPDDELFAAARAKTLTASRQGLADQARRLLGGPGGQATIETFHHHLLNLGSFQRIEKDAKAVPGYVPALRDDMYKEALALVRDVAIERGQGLSGLLTASHTFVNARLARLYDLPGSFTDDKFVRVDLDPSRRLGLLTSTGFLSLYAHGLEPDIIHRGLFVAENLLCKPLPPPPDDIQVPKVDPTLTNRQRIEAISGKGTCGEACHSTFINPPGYALEGYDGLGRVRPTDQGKPVDTAGSYRLDGEVRTFSNAVELARLLAASQEAHQCYAGHWLEFLHARPRQESDAKFLADLATRSQAGRLSPLDLIVTLVTSDAFLARPL